MIDDRDDKVTSAIGTVGNSWCWMRVEWGRSRLRALHGGGWATRANRLESGGNIRLILRKPLPFLLLPIYSLRLIPNIPMEKTGNGR